MNRCFQRLLAAALILGSPLLWAHMGAQTERDLLDHLIEKTPGEQLWTLINQGIALKSILDGMSSK